MSIKAKVKVPLRVVRSFLGIQRKRMSYEHERLFTPWGEQVQSAVEAGGEPDVRAEHPHPQFRRDSFAMLNGWWGFATERLGSQKEASLHWVDAQPPADFSERILVPFPPESALSQVERTVRPNEVMWYRREFATPQLERGERLLLHFEAVDWACSVRVNGKLADVHTGGYLPFHTDITDFLDPTLPCQEIVVCAYDPSEFGVQLRGKQRIERIGMWYTAQSGIWQPVWLERVPEARIVALQVDSFNLNGSIACTVECTAPEGGDATLRVTAFDGQAKVAEATCAVPAATRPDGETVAVSATLEVPDPKLWSPESPHLYTLVLEYGADRVQSYCGFRTVSVQPDASGTPRLMLNGETRFAKGLLDQGYWPEGLMTAPSLQALTFDAQAIRRLGFNMARKHIKVESDLWYAECDRLGVLVWQDVPTGGVGWNEWQTTVKPSTFPRHRADRDDTPAAHRRHSAASATYQQEWAETALGMVRYLKSHPCVMAWGLFNEGWGQFHSARAVAAVRAEDPTRPIDAASGWFDQGAGDFASAHDYAKRPDGAFLSARDGRAKVLAEFGGLSLSVPGHVFNDHSFGYQKWSDAAAWRTSVDELVGYVEQMEADGLAGYVYTQLTDVEEETNGLLTYDRQKKA